MLIPAPTLPRICKQQFIERGVCRDGDRIRRSSGIAAHLFDRRRRWLEGRMGLVGPPLPFLHAASPTSIQRSIQREGRRGGRRGGKGKGGEGRESGACAPPSPPLHTLAARPSRHPGPRLTGPWCAAFHLTGVPQSGQVRPATSSYLEDTLEEIGLSHGGGFQATMTPS